MRLNSSEQIPLELFTDGEQTVDNFISGSNDQIIGVVCDLKEGSGPQFTYLWGDRGVGKTHLLRALGLSGKGVPSFNEAQSIYCVDDIQNLDAEEQQSLFNLYNEVRLHTGTHLVVTADRSPKEFEQEGLREDLTSRFTWGIVVEVLPLSDQKKREEILKRVTARGLIVSEDVLKWIDNNLPRDMRSLTSLLSNVDRYALSTKRGITIPLIKEWLQNHPQ